MEDNFEQIFDYANGEMLTQVLQEAESVYGRYTNSDLNKKGRLVIHLEVQDAEVSSIAVRYRISQGSDDVTLTQD